MGAHDSDDAHPVLRAISVPPRTCFGPGFCATLAAHDTSFQSHIGRVGWKVVGVWVWDIQAVVGSR